jgi:hypothetical protein
LGVVRSRTWFIVIHLHIGIVILLGESGAQLVDLLGGIAVVLVDQLEESFLLLAGSAVVRQAIVEFVGKDLGFWAHLRGIRGRRGHCCFAAHRVADDLV